MAQRQVTTGRSFERLVNFSDGVVAVAVTVLVLPIVDIAPPKPPQDMWDVIVANSGQLIAYLITFYVVLMLWLAHHRLFSYLGGYDSILVALNSIWLVTLALLPWPSNLIEDVQSFTSGVGVLYFGLMTVNSLSLTLMFTYSSRHKDLWAPGVVAPPNSNTRGWIFFGILSALTISSLVAPWLTPFLTIALPVLSIVIPKRKPVAASDSDVGEA